jgi:SAM-dependent methyltransferase
MTGGEAVRGGDWHAVWSRRAPDAAGDDDALARLVALDGFDAGAGRIAVDDWRAHARTVAERLGLGPGSDVYEVGCGAGAFLYALRELGVRVAGMDYAENLVGIARRCMPEGRFDHAQARALNPSPPADVVLANSVFHYFPDLRYAEEVLDRMLAKAVRAVAIFEVPDAARRDDAEAMRRDALDPAAYAEKYRGLEHLYYPRAWFRDQAERRGLRHAIFDQCVPNYRQNAYRFNCVIFPPDPPGAARGARLPVAAARTSSPPTPPTAPHP